MRFMDRSTSNSCILEPFSLSLDFTFSLRCALAALAMFVSSSVLASSVLASSVLASSVLAPPRRMLLLLLLPLK